MNSTEHAQQHAAEAERVTRSWQRPLDPHFEAQQRARATEQAAKSEALRRSLDSYRNPGESPR